MHNVRHMWLAVAAKGKPLPGKLARATVSKPEVMQALDHPEGKVKGFRPDVVGMFGYLLSHDAHHRGQISVLAR